MSRSKDAAINEGWEALGISVGHGVVVSWIAWNSDAASAGWTLKVTVLRSAEFCGSATLLAFIAERRECASNVNKAQNQPL